ncbi:MAG TPA: hypothetical protein VFY79_00350 [Dehalococcoidia bacterium]|nr:hypothetical protein [Dehalococcoidia bacterium]
MDRKYRPWLVVALVAAVAILLAQGAGTTYANPDRVWVVNEHVAQSLNGGAAVDFTSTSTPNSFAGVVAQLDAMDAASAGQISSDPGNAGHVYIVVRTDGSTTGVTLNGAGLTCTAVVTGAPPPAGNACSGVTSLTPVTVTAGTFVVFEVTGTGSAPATFTVTATQDSVALSTGTLSLVGPATNLKIVAAGTNQIASGSTSCPLDVTAPPATTVVASYTDGSAHALVGYRPTISASDASAIAIANPTGAISGADAASQSLTTMKQSDGTTVGAPARVCGLVPGFTFAVATDMPGEIPAIPGTLSKVTSITVVGPPVSIDLSADPASVACDGVQGSTVTASIYDTLGTPVLDGTTVNFSASSGSAMPSSATTSGGTATSAIVPAAGAQSVDVTVTAGSASNMIAIPCDASTTPTPTASATSAPTDTPPPTDTPTPTSTATNTSTPTPTATDTATPASTATATGTNTPTATVTPTNTATATNTATPTNTATATNTATPTNTSTATATNTPTAVATATNTPTSTATRTAMPTNTATATNTPRATSTSTAVPTATATPGTLPHHKCVNSGQRVRIAMGIVRWLGARAGDRHYQAQYDLNGNGVIDPGDLAVLLSMRPC